jgi:hypothetical protein
MTEAKPIPKSLHTVRVLAIMAQHFLDEGATRDEEPYGLSRSEAVSYALLKLGYDGTPDTHGLKAKALKAMAAERGA